MTTRALLLVTVFAPCLLVQRTARADRGAIVVHGDATEHDRSTVNAAIEHAARLEGLELTSKPLPAKASDALLSCNNEQAPWTCVPAQIIAGGVDRIILVAVQNKQGPDGAPMIVLRGRVLATDLQLAVEQQAFCEQCADDKLADASGSLVQQLLRELAVRSGRTILAVRSVPPGAQILVDGKAVGATDASINTYPGEHVVILEKPGFDRAYTTVTVDEGKTRDVALTLHATASGATPPGPSTPPPARRPSLVVPGIVAGVGLVALVGGIYVSASASQSTTGPQPRYVYSGPGIGVAVAGGLAVAVGVYLWRHDRVRSSTPTVSWLPGGATVGWASTF